MSNENQIPLTKIKEIVSIIQKYQNKDYFFDKDQIRNKIDHFKRAKESGQEIDPSINPQYIERVLLKNSRVMAFYGTFSKIALAVQIRDLKTLKNRLRYDQKMSLEFFECLTGIKLGKTNKVIESQLIQFCK